MPPFKPSGNVIVGETPHGEAISEFKSAGGATVRVLNAGVYKEAADAAGKMLREFARGKSRKTRSSEPIDLNATLNAAPWMDPKRRVVIRADDADDLDGDEAAKRKKPS